MILDIKFESKEDRKKFEKHWKMTEKDILVDEYSNSHGFFAWTFSRDVSLNPVYYFGFMGYAEPEEMLDESLKKGIKIKFFAWIPINDKNSSWEKIRGRW